MAERHWDAALVDIKMPGTDGIELQRRLKEIDPELIVIIMTGYASVETAVQALKNGAYDYVTKPFDPDDIAHVVRNALEHRRMARENVKLKETELARSRAECRQELARREQVMLKETVAEVARPPELVGQSTAMKKVFDAIETVGPTDATVLITGESGTGKELVARAIHALSPRRFNPLVAIHCGALTETLLESELFGHEKGAFTGAQYRKKGKFAEGGSVLLDEIGDISLKTQTDLLRVLQEREITRVGGNQPIKVDFRCIAATNKRLETLVEEGKFRPDLYYRLNVFRLEVPSLRERKEDIPLLVEHFIRRFSQAMNKRIVRVAPGAMALLQQYDWPGNVRELENAVERAMVVAQEPELREEDFTLKLGAAPEAAPQTLEEVERAHILKVLEECGGNQTRAAEKLDIDRVTLYNKLKKWKKAAVGG
jgi:DNA-binding NtrC family response regulator